MKWYSTGGIAEAITYSKSKGTVFVVYIEGTDENSQKITNLIDNGELGQKLEQNCFVAVKLQGGSIEHQQFSEIYKEPSIPSLYFIGKNGVPLDIIKGNDDLENVCQRVDQILLEAGFNSNLFNSIPASVASDNFIKNELAAGSSSVANDNFTGEVLDKKIAEGNLSETTTEEVLNKNEEDETKKEEKNESLEEKSEDNEISPEEKLKRAQELIELKKQAKEQEEKENERLKELERRKMGQNVQQLKKWQEDQELKQLKEDREREKRENQQARERVLAQIAQDRAERMSKSPSNSPSPPETLKTASQSPPKVSSNITRLQFKMPDGSSTTHEFENSDTLENVVGYIRANLPLPFSNFTLSTVFPRREFTRNDYPQSLIDLQLSPTAVMLILPQSSGPVSGSTGLSLTTLLWTFLSPIFSIFDYFKSLVFGSTSSSRTQKRPSPDEPTESKRHPSSKRKPSDPTTVVRRQGNIHRLSDKNDSDDENNTWNGNSTQQM